MMNYTINLIKNINKRRSFTAPFSIGDLYDKY